MVATLRAADSFQKRRLLGAILAVRRTGRASATSVDLLTEPPQLVAERLRPINLALGYLDRRFKPCQQDVEYRLSAGVEHPAHGDLSALATAASNAAQAAATVSTGFGIGIISSAGFCVRLNNTSPGGIPGHPEGVIGTPSTLNPR
jgi:hypothetical protein